MLEFKPLKLEDIDTVRPFLMAEKSRICDSSPGVIFMWRGYYGTEFAVEGGNLYFKIKLPIGTSFTLPTPDAAGGADALEEYCRRTGTPLKLCVIEESELDFVRQRFPNLTIGYDESSSDYLYEAENFKTYPGKIYHGQRNFVSRFMREHPDACVEQLDSSNVEAAKRFLDVYYAEIEKEASSFRYEREIAYEILDRLDTYRFGGIVLRTDGRVVGVACGETIGDTLFAHFEKAERNIPGAYQTLAQNFVKTFAGEGIRYLNREDDAGDLGLRRSKESYHPIEKPKKYYAV